MAGAEWISDIDKEVSDTFKDNGNVKSKEDICKELGQIDKETLVQSRLDLYEVCKNRLFEKAAVEEGGEPTACWLDEGWELKERRMAKWIIEDVYDLWMYASDGSPKFPKEILILKNKTLAGKPTKPQSVSADVNVELVMVKESLASLVNRMEKLKDEQTKMRNEHESEIQKIRADYTKEVTALHGIIANLQQDKPTGDAENRTQDDKGETTAAPTPDTEPTDQGNPPVGVGDQRKDETPGNDQTQAEAAQSDASRHGASKRTEKEANGYSRVLGKEEIKERQEKKKEQARQAKGKTASFKLEGAPKIVTQSLYLENVKVPVGASNGQVIASVCGHAKKNQIDVMACFVRRNKYVQNTVGCRITVAESQVQRCKFHNVWPQYVVCRDWVPRSSPHWNSSRQADAAPRDSWFQDMNSRRDNDWGDWDRDQSRWESTERYQAEEDWE